MYNSNVFWVEIKVMSTRKDIIIKKMKIESEFTFISAVEIQKWYFFHSLSSQLFRLECLFIDATLVCMFHNNRALKLYTIATLHYTYWTLLLEILQIVTFEYWFILLFLLIYPCDEFSFFILNNQPVINVFWLHEMSSEVWINGCLISHGKFHMMMF